MGKLLANQIRGINPLAKKGVLLLWAFLLSFACLSVPHSAEAAVTALTGNSWRTTSGTTISATSYFRGTTAVPGATNTYAIASGPNRLLVVVLSFNTSAAQNSRIPTVKYGLAGSENQTLTLATSDQATSSRQHTWIFYLNEAGIAAANGTNLSFTYTGTVPTYTGTYANAAVYQNVDQTTPVLTPTTFNSGATANTQVGPLGTSQVVAAGDLVVEMANTLNTAAATAATFTFDTTPAAWTTAQTTSRTGTTPANYGARFAVLTQATAGTHDSTHTASANVLDSMSAITLKAGVVDTVKPTVLYFEAPTSSSTAVISPITFTASDDTAVTGWLINESATPPAATAITATTAPTSYTVGSSGTKTLYAWVKDANGNVSNLFTAQTCLVTLPSPPARSANWTAMFTSIAPTGTPATGTYPSGNLGNFTVPAGTNRLLVVAVATTSIANSAHTYSDVVWGGKILTRASGDESVATQWNHSALYYLKEADIAAASGNALTFTATGGTPYYSYVYAAVYTGVDQTNPVPQATNYNNGAANTVVGPFTPALTVNAYHQAVEVLNVARATTGTTGRTVTFTGGWTAAGIAPTGIVASGPCMQLYIRDRAVPVVDTNDTSQHTASGNSFDSMTAMTIRNAQDGVNLTTGATVANSTVNAGDKTVPVDAFTLQTSVADTVTGIQITGSAASSNTTVERLQIFRKIGTTPAIYEPGDVEIANVANPFAGGLVANIALAEPINGVENYIIVYDIAATASQSVTNTLTASVTGLTVTNPGTYSDPLASSGTITIHPITTIGNGVEVLPLTGLRLYKASAATILDSFTLSHNSANTANDDQIDNVTVTLTPAGISGGGAVASKISKVEIVSQDGNTVYGLLTAPTTGDIWNISTKDSVPPLVATNTEATYYVRITTPAIINSGYYTVGGTVTSAQHAKATSKLVISDSTSRTLSIDVEAPIGPTTFNATTPPDAPPPGGGKINLSWNAASDPNSGALDGTTPYLLVRSAAGGTDPAVNCVPNVAGGDVLIPLGDVLSYTDSGLNDTQAPIYHYRICAKDTLGNISAGTTVSKASSYSNYCDVLPDVTLGVDDPLNRSVIQDQLVKSFDNKGGTTNPFLIQITNNDIGTCPPVEFNIAVVDAYTTGGSGTGQVGDPLPSVNDFSLTYPSTVTLGKSISKTSSIESLFINGLSTADQIQKYTFRVRVSGAGHPSVLNKTENGTEAYATAVLNDMPPIVHNSNNMAKFQYGTWGNEYTCATCHSNSTTNIKGIYEIISTPIGKKNVVFTKTSSLTTDYVGVYGNDLRPNKTTSNNVCSVCHHKTRQHQYSANKTEGGPAGFTSPYVTDHHNSGDCVRCHTHNTAFKSILGVCGDCHGFKGTQYAPISKSTMVRPPTNALGTNPPSYGAHARHNKAQMSCAVCHTDTNHGLSTNTWIGDDKLEIGFRIDNTTFPGFNPAAPQVGGVFEGTSSLNTPYAWAPSAGTTLVKVTDYNASCSTYCHGAWQGNVGSNTKPNWVGSGQAVCGGCHNATPEQPPVSGSHAMHAGTGAVRTDVTGLGIACDKCHSTFTSYTGSAHINGNVEWNLSLTSPTALYNGQNSSSTGAAAPSSSYNTCTNLYCHSNVQGADGLGAPSSYAAPQWGDNNITDFDINKSAYCGSCHIYPNTVGGHEQHESLEFAFDCHVCHNNGGRTTPANHANGKINFQFAGLGANTVYKGISTSGLVTPGSGYGSCNNSNCHGRYTRTWGPPTATVLCEKCHGTRESARGFYNTRGPDGTLSIYSAGIGVHDIHLQNPNSPRKATFNRFTSFAVGMNCNQCHIPPSGPFSAGHMDNKLPAEVPFTNATSIAHNGEAFGYYSTPRFVANTCYNVWCHGSGMASNNALGNYSRTVPAVRPQAPTWVQSSGSPTMLSTGDPCIKCHAMPPQVKNSDSTHWNKEVIPARAYNRSECVTCHGHLNAAADGFKDKSLHINGVIDGGCNSCHGDPPVLASVGENGLAKQLQNALSPGKAGAHAAHTANASIGKTCSTCHYNYSKTMPSDMLELGFNAYGGKVTSGSYSAYSSPAGGANWINNNAGTVITVVDNLASANVCSNLYCHGSTIDDTGNTGINKTPNWEEAGQAVCGTCHGGDPANVPTPALSGAHSRHASNNISGGKPGLAISCGSCHGASSQSLAHVNGEVTWDLDSANPKIGPNASYKTAHSGTTGALAPSATYGTCSTFYCHSNVQGAGGIGVPGTYYDMTWGSSPAMTCGSCHLTQVATGTASHTAHTALYGGSTSCGYCHHGAGANTEFHADAMIYVNITTSKLGTGVYTGSNRLAGSAAGYGSCSNIICHGAATITWGNTAMAAAPQCQKCHGSKSAGFLTVTSAQVAPGYGTDGIATDGSTSATSRRVGAHQKHLAANAVNTRVKCSECHVKVTGILDNGHLNYTTATITFSGRATGNNAPATPGRNASGVITCSTTWCHTATNNTGTKPVPVWTDTAYMNESGTTVAECVGCHAMPPKGVGITDHETITMVTTDALSTVATKCNGCHYNNMKASPANAADVFVDKSTHVNGVVNAQGGHAFPYYGVTHDTDASPITVCTGCHTNSKNPSFYPYPVSAGVRPDCQGCHTKGSPGTGCNSCHGAGATASKPDGNTFPNISGSHTKHVVGQGLACSVCHGSYGGGGTDTTHGSSNRVAHNNSYVNVTSASGSQFHFSWAGGTGKGTCSNVACHGTAEWGVTKFNCLTCHSVAVGPRAAVVGQFASQSHHIQGAELPLTTAHCAKCHWEAKADGSIDPVYHSGTSGKGVSLVVWKSGATTYSATRPTVADANTYVSYTANGSRKQISKLNAVCLGCHNSLAKTGANLFGTYLTDEYAPEAKLSSPKAKTSILSRYSSTRTVAWSQTKYSSATGGVARFGTNNKYSVTKALSAHGNAVKNQFPVIDTFSGEDDHLVDSAFSANLGANRNVLCYDCHNSHGSDATGITSSYSSATGRYKGGLLKSTVAGQGGYTVTYKPQGRDITYRNVSGLGQATVTTTTNKPVLNGSATYTMNPGASICNDCHNNDTARVNISKPWSITETYSSTKAIVGYWSTPYFDNYTVSSTKRSPYKVGGATINAKDDRRKPMGGHFGSSVSTRSAGHSGDINGLCTPCHDPHGVSNALSADRDHGVPLLKGTWVTTPYREDKADALVVRGGGRNVANIGLKGAVPGYHIDQNTFMVTPAPNSAGAGTATTRSNLRRQTFRSFSNLSTGATGVNNGLTSATFAGLCLECHKQDTLTGTAGRPAAAAAWKTPNRIHQSVAGWSASGSGTTNLNNTVHAYTCAKCHAPHVSRLPRLLVTNCLDQRHYGKQLNTTISSTASGTTNGGNIHQSTVTSARGAGRFPGGGSRYSGTPSSAQNPGGWWFQTNGAAGTTQPTSTPNVTDATLAKNNYGSACHNTSTSGGTTYSPLNQMWNKKSSW